MPNHRIRRSAAPAVLAAAMVVGAAPAGWSTTTSHAPAPSASAPAAHHGKAAVQSFPPCTNPPIAIAQWWKKSGWVRNGNKNKQYRLDEGGTVRYINGGKDYKNVSNPRLPQGTYNEYDASPRSRPDASRNSQRLVRSTSGDVYYTADHYRSFCDMGGGWRR